VRGDGGIKGGEGGDTKGSQIKVSKAYKYKETPLGGPRIPSPKRIVLQQKPPGNKTIENIRDDTKQGGLGGGAQGPLGRLSSTLHNTPGADNLGNVRHD